MGTSVFLLQVWGRVPATDLSFVCEADLSGSASLPNLKSQEPAPEGQWRAACALCAVQISPVPKGFGGRPPSAAAACAPRSGSTPPRAPGRRRRMERPGAPRRGRAKRPHPWTFRPSAHRAGTCTRSAQRRPACARPGCLPRARPLCRELPNAPAGSPMTLACSENDPE